MASKDPNATTPNNPGVSTESGGPREEATSTETLGDLEASQADTGKGGRTAGSAAPSPDGEAAVTPDRPDDARPA
jgi:hypothetical protein